MKLFEASFSDGKSCTERFFNTETQRSESAVVPLVSEYFLPCSSGEFELITDQNIKLRRVEGSPKQARDQIGSTPAVYKNIRDKYWNSGNFNLNPRIMYLDIETRATGSPDPKNAPEQVVLIQMLDTKNNEIYVVGLRPWEPEPDYKLEYPVKYIYCKDEVKLLDTFLKIFEALNPVVVYAWNGEGFDFPYLYNRIKKLGLGTNRLSCYGDVKLEEVDDIRTHRKCFKLTSNGHYFMDLLEVYRRYQLDPRPSYALDTIAEIEVHSNKIEHTEFPTFDSFYTAEYYNIRETPYDERVREEIRQLHIRQNSLVKDSEEYRNNRAEIMRLVNFQFVYYGVRDVVLLRKIDEKLNLTKIVTNIAKTMGVLYNDVLGTVKPWSQYISNVALSEGLVMPKREEQEVTQYEGAFVRDPAKGKHKWVMNFDVNSMYPQYSIAGFGMSPEALVPVAKMEPDLRELVLRYFVGKSDQEILDVPEEVWNKVSPVLRKYNLTLTANGVCYRKDVNGIIPRLVNKIYDGRKLDKKQQFKYEQRLVEIEAILKERGA